MRRPWFQPEGAIIKGYRVGMTIQELHQRNDIFKEVPDIFSSFLSEPAFMIEESTFCIWRIYDDTSWRQGSVSLLATPKSGGAQELLSILDGNPRTYQNFAEAYYERPINIDVISHIYHHKPLTEKVVHQLNPDIWLEDVEEDIEEIIYPLNNG
jgi:hypothetical protein